MKVNVNKSIDDIVGAEVRELVHLVREYISYAAEIDFQASSGSHNGVIEGLKYNQLEFANAAVRNLLNGEIVSCGSDIRRMQENYIIASIIDKYQSENAWSKWVRAGFSKKRSQLNKHGIHLDGEYSRICRNLGLSCNDSVNASTYGWIKGFDDEMVFGDSASRDVYTVNRASKLVDDDVYEDFGRMSTYAHYNDFFDRYSGPSEPEVLSLVNDIMLYFIQMFKIKSTSMLNTELLVYQDIILQEINENYNRIEKERQNQKSKKKSKKK